MSNTDDVLFRGLQMLQQGVQQAATSYAINDAQKLVQDINLNIANEGKKRQALQQLGNDLALKLTGMGATGTQIQAAFNAINPPSFGSAEQMELEGVLAENPQLTGGAQKVYDRKRMQARQDALFQHELDLEKLRMQAALRPAKEGEKAKPLNQGVIKDEINPVVSSLETVKIIEKKLDAMRTKTNMATGPGSSLFGLRGLVNPELKAFQDDIKAQFQEYRRYITGAAAAIPELADIKDTIPNEDDAPWVIKARLENHRQRIERALRGKLRTYEEAGYDIKGLNKYVEGNRQESNQAATQTQQPSSKADKLLKHAIENK